MSELILDPEHRYWIAERQIPGVTQAIAGLGLIETRWFTEESRIRGSAVHAALHYHLEGDLHWPSVDERIRGYVDAALGFLTDSKFETVEVEKRVLRDCPGLPPYAGTLDLLGKLGGVEVVADWKSTAVSDLHGLQIAAYDMALGGKRRKRVGVQLRADGKYKMKVLDDRRDYERFASIIDLFTRYVFNPRAAA